MKVAIRRQLRNLVALIVLTVTALCVGVFIVDHQNGEFPAWMPIIGDDPYVVSAELSTAQGVIPGQGQLVEVAGVIVGRVDGVHLENGRAVLSLHLERGKVKLFRDASILMRPRTLLKDMILQVTPGTPQAGRLREDDRIPIANTLPDVNLDEVLSALDADTRDALIALAQGADQGLDGQGDELAALFRRFDPTMRQLQRLNDAVIGRRRAIRRTVTNFSLIARTLAKHKRDLTGLVVNADAVFGALADEQAGVRATLRELPATLSAVSTTSRAIAPVARDLGDASAKLLPGARSLGGGATALDGLFGDTRATLSTQLRPLARAALPPLRSLRAATDGAARTSEAGAGALHDLNGVFDDYAHDPGHGQHSYLYWSAWSAHQLNSILSSQDALGPFAHTLTVMTCSSLGLLPGFVASDPALALTVSLANFPTQEQVCQ